MQVLPSTGRSYARQSRRAAILDAAPDGGRGQRAASARRSSPTRSASFGGVHFALAAYNAGDSRVAGVAARKPGLPQDEFIDDIPFPETQNYVKRILGTAEDYRVFSI